MLTEFLPLHSQRMMAEKMPLVHLENAAKSKVVLYGRTHVLAPLSILFYPSLILSSAASIPPSSLSVSLPIKPSTPSGVLVSLPHSMSLPSICQETRSHSKLLMPCKVTCALRPRCRTKGTGKSAVKGTGNSDVKGMTKDVKGKSKAQVPLVSRADI